VGAGGADAGQAELITSKLFDHSPGGRGRGDLAEQLRLVPQAARSLRQSPPSASSTARSRSTRPAWWRCRRVLDRSARQPSAPVSPSRSASSASSAAPAWPTTPVPSVVTSNLAGDLVACTRKVPSSSGECDLEQPHSASSGGHLRYHGTVTQDAREKPRLTACCRNSRVPRCPARGGCRLLEDAGVRVGARPRSSLGSPRRPRRRGAAPSGALRR
jgi:hypothetical protein